MNTEKLTLTRRFPWLNDWGKPFLWLALTPIITVTAGAIAFELVAVRPEEIGLPPNPNDCGNGLLGPTCYEYAPVIPAMLAFTVPGLVNLVPFLWALSDKRKTRLAGIAAGLMGLMRALVPLLLSGLAFHTVSRDGPSYFEFSSQVFGPPDPYGSLWLAGGLVWFASLLVWALFGWLVKDPA